MVDYEEIRECIVKILESGPLMNKRICEKVHEKIPDKLSPDSVDCPHTDWSQKEWEHEVRRAIYQLKQKDQIIYDEETQLYKLNRE